MNTIERITELLNKEGISAAKMMRELGFSSGLFSQWKSGKQNPSADKLAKIAEYLHTTTDYLLGTESNPSATVTDDDLKFALFNGADGITDEMFAEVKWFARVVKEREEAKRAKIEKAEYIFRSAARNGEAPHSGTMTQAEIDEIESLPDADPNL